MIGMILRVSGARTGSRSLRSSGRNQSLLLILLVNFFNIVGVGGLGVS